MALERYCLDRHLRHRLEDRRGSSGPRWHGVHRRPVPRRNRHVGRLELVSTRRHLRRLGPRPGGRRLRLLIRGWALHHCGRHLRQPRGAMERGDLGRPRQRRPRWRRERCRRRLGWSLRRRHVHQRRRPRIEARRLVSLVGLGWSYGHTDNARRPDRDTDPGRRVLHTRGPTLLRWLRDHPDAAELLGRLPERHGRTPEGVGERRLPLGPLARRRNRRLCNHEPRDHPGRNRGSGLLALDRAALRGRPAS